MACSDALKELQQQEKELAAQKIDNIINEYDNKLSIINGNRSINDAQRSLSEKRGETLDSQKTYYEKNAKEDEDYLSGLIDARNKVQNELNTLMKKGLVEEGDDTWQKAQEQLQKYDEDIIKTKEDILDINEAIENIKFEKWGYMTDALDASNKNRQEEKSLSDARGKTAFGEYDKKYYADQIKNIEDQNKVLETENDELIKLRDSVEKGSKKWQEYQKQIDDNTSTMNQNLLTIEEYNDEIGKVDLTKLGYQMDALSDEGSRLNDELSHSSSKSMGIVEYTYRQMIKNGDEQIGNLKAQKAANEAMMAGLDKNSQKYIELAAANRGIDASIRSLTYSTEEWQQAIDDLPLEKLKWVSETLQASGEKLNNVISLKEARGDVVTSKDYLDQIINATSQVKNLNEQYDILFEKRRKTDYGSEDWKNLTKEMSSLDSEANNLLISIEQWRNEIQNIEIEKYEQELARLEASEKAVADAVKLRVEQGKEISKDYYEEQIDLEKIQIKLLKQEKIAYTEQLKTVEKGSKEYNEIIKSIEDTDSKIRSLTLSIEDLSDEMNELPLKKLSWQLDAVSVAADRMDKSMSLHEAQGVNETSESYKELIENGMKQIEILEEENRQYKELQSGMDEMSDEYQDYQSKINSNISAIEDMKIAQEQWNDAIVDLGISHLQKYKDTLTKTNEEYERQKTLQESLQQLEKARSQRKLRTYVEGVGFVYEADQDELKTAQENLENVVKDQLLGKIDDLINALEESKKDTNVYDANGNLLGSVYNTPELGTLSSILSNYYSNGVTLDANVLRDALGKDILGNIGTTNNKNISLDLGGITINEVKDGNDLANAIINQLPSALLQALYQK